MVVSFWPWLSGAAVLNGIGLLITWMKYRILAYESLIFANEVLCTLHGEEEDYPPPDLAAGKRTKGEHPYRGNLGRHHSALV